MLIEIEEETKRITIIVELIKNYVKSEYKKGYFKSGELSINEEKISIFYLELKNLCEKANFPLESMRDKFNMTLLMNLVISIEDIESYAVKSLEMLIAKLIRENTFSDEYLSHRANIKLEEQFQLQHVHGICKLSKKKNTHLAPGQVIQFKKVVKKNVDGEYRPINCSVEGQEKLISKHPVEIIKEGNTREYKRIMVSGKIIKRNEDDDNQLIGIEIDEHESRGSLSTISSSPTRDDFEIEEDYKKEKVNVLFNEYDTQEDSESKCKNWILNENNAEEDDTLQNTDEIFPSTSLIPEHLDSQSVAKMTSGETFKTKQNKYKYAPSSTKYADTHGDGQIPSKLISKKTNVFILACRTKQWEIVKAILELDPNKYPMLLEITGIGGKQASKHPLYHEDDKGNNGFFLILNEICSLEKSKVNDLHLLKELAKLTISHIDAHTLKTKNIQKGKTPLQFIEEKQNDNLDVVKSLIEKEINPGYKEGTSCGFKFSSYDSKIWKCIKCKVEVRTNANLQLEDLNHYIRYFQLSYLIL